VAIVNSIGNHDVAVLCCAGIIYCDVAGSGDGRGEHGNVGGLLDHWKLGLQGHSIEWMTLFNLGLVTVGVAVINHGMAAEQ
jgi:hypothetical protein